TMRAPETARAAVLTKWARVCRCRRPNGSDARRDADAERAAVVAEYVRVHRCLTPKVSDSLRESDTARAAVVAEYARVHRCLTPKVSDTHHGPSSDGLVAGLAMASVRPGAAGRNRQYSHAAAH